MSQQLFVFVCPEVVASLLLLLLLLPLLLLLFADGIWPEQSSQVNYQSGRLLPPFGQKDFTCNLAHTHTKWQTSGCATCNLCICIFGIPLYSPRLPAFPSLIESLEYAIFQKSLEQEKSTTSKHR